MRKASAPLALALLVLAPVAAHAAAGAGIRAEIEMTRIDSPSISPDGRLVVWREARASIDRNAYDIAWFVAPADGSKPPRRFADAGEPTLLNGTMLARTPIWTSDSRAILFRKLAKGEAQVWRAEVDGNDVRQLTHEDGNVTDVAALENGHKIAVAVGRSRAAIALAEEEEKDRGTLIDASVDPQRPLYRGDWIDGRWATGRLRGAWFEQGGILPKQAPHLEILDPQSGMLRDASGQEQQVYAPPIKGFDKLGGEFVMVRAESGDNRGNVLLLGKGQDYHLVLAAPDGKEVARCTDALCNPSKVRSINWIGHRNEVMLEVRQTPNNSSLIVWNLADRSTRQLVVGEGLLEGGADLGDPCAAHEVVIACVAASANVPPHLVLVDPQSGALRTLASPNPELPSSEPHFAPLNWVDAEGRPFSGFIALPLGHSGPVPLFITYYSCAGYLRGGLGDEFPLRALAAHGIAAMCINRSAGFVGGGRNTEAYAVAEAGIGTIIDKLAAEGTINPAHVGVGGVSFGGEVAAWLAIHTHRLRALSVANVMLTPAYYWYNAVAGRDVAGVLRSSWGIGDPDHDRKGWRRISPAFNADRISAPFLMQVPEQEYRSNVELLSRLQRAGKPAELWAFPQEMHIKWQPRHQLAANERNLDWFRFWLAGEVDPDPAKAAQYVRWRGYGSPSQVRAQASVSIKGKSR